MEELLVYVLLAAEELLPWEAYESRLHALFLEHPEDDLLMDLECETSVAGTRSYIRRYFDYGCSVFDRGAFGMCLMDKLARVYGDAGDIEMFSTKMYSLWKELPGDLQFEQPFWTLSYADDCLSYGEEGQARTMYEEAFQFYKSNKTRSAEP